MRYNVKNYSNYFMSRSPDCIRAVYTYWSEEFTTYQDVDVVGDLFILAQEVLDEQKE